MVFSQRKTSRIFLLIGVICMMNACGCAENFEYEKYSAKDPELNFTLDYISGWLHSEQAGSKGSFSQAVFYEPSTKEHSSVAAMVATVENTQNLEIKPATIDARAEDILSRRLKFKDAQLLSKNKREILGLSALDMKLSYKTLDKLYSVDAKPRTVTEKIIVLKRKDKFYTLRYQNKAEEFDKFSKAFDHLVRSLKFKDK